MTTNLDNFSTSQSQSTPNALWDKSILSQSGIVVQVVQQFFYTKKEIFFE